MQPASTLFSTANVICFPDQKTPCSVQVVPKILYPIFLPLCCVIPSYKAPLQAVEPAAALWQPCPALWERLQAKHRNSRGWSNPSLHCRDHMRNICTSSCLLPSYPPQTQCASQLLKQTKEKGAVHSLLQLLTTLPVKNLQNTCIFMQQESVYLIKS